MAATRSLYDVLGVPRSATDEQVKGAYRKLAKKFHPDRNPGDTRAQDRFKEVASAYEVLSDGEKRKNYDEFGDIALQSGFDADKARAFSQWQSTGAGGRGFQGFSGGFGPGGGGGVPPGFESVLEEMFAGGGQGRARRGPRRGGDIEVESVIAFLTAVNGGEVALTLAREGVCEPCSGTGGRPTAKGTREACRECMGTGSRQRTETLRVRIPPGVDEGGIIRLAGKGGPGREGGPAGDLRIHVHLEPHRVFRRDGRDVLLTVPITVGEALLGGSVPVPTPTGEVTLKVPPGSQTGRRLRLRGKGVPAYRGREAGDLLATLEVRVPDGSGEELAAAAQALDAFYTRDLRADLRD